MRRLTPLKKGRNLCGGFWPFFVRGGTLGSPTVWERKGESQRSVLVSRAESDPPDCVDRDDQLSLPVLVWMRRQRHEAEPGLRGERLEGDPLAVGELQFDVRFLGLVGCGEALDLTMDALDEIIEGRLGRARNPHLRHGESVVG